MNMSQAEMKLKLTTTRMDLYADKDALSIKLDTQSEIDKRKLYEVQFETEKEKVTNQLTLDQLEHDSMVANLQEELKIKNDFYTPTVLKSMALETTKDIYKSLNIKNMKVVNMAGGKEGGNSTHEAMAQILASSKAVSTMMEN